jgi:exodeoxyribonuclease VII small subunit
MTQINPTTQSKQSLEEMINRIVKIQKMIENKEVSLSDSMPLLEEAYQLKKKVEEILLEIENKIITLNNHDRDV